MGSNRNFIAPQINNHENVPLSVPKGKFLWHNQVERCVAMPHGLNGFRYWHGTLPINYRQFERCRCGVTELPHYKMRGLGTATCVSPDKVWRNATWK